MDESYFILLADKVATKRERGLTSRPLHARQSNDSDTHVVAGSLWKIPYDELSHKRSATLCSVEFEGVVLQNFPLNSHEIQKLTKEQFDLLHAVPTCQDRFNVFRDAKWMTEATYITQGSIVYLINMPGFVESRIPGIVRYKGPLPNENGTWFGVELSAEFKGKGTSDGVFKRKRYFTCHMNSAVFKPISRLGFCEHPAEFHQMDGYCIKARNPSSIPPRPPLNLGDRVVWISDIGPENATVKWIGILQDAREPVEWMVGVEFENQVGTGTGKYKDEQLFKAPQGHASLVPVLGLMKQSEFYGPPVIAHVPPASSTPTAMSKSRETVATIERRCVSPELQNISREESNLPHEKYEPTIDSNVTSPTTKPYSADNNITHEHFTATVPMRDAAQYYGTKSNTQNSAIVTNRSESNHSFESVMEPTQDHLNRFNELGEAGRFSTMHHSQPSQVTSKNHDEKWREVSTTDRPVHKKYQQNDRYQKAVTGPFTEFVNLPPERPYKQIQDKEGMSIYDQHPYENVDGGPVAPVDSTEDIYEATAFTGRSPDTYDDWDRVPRGSEQLVGQPKYRSSVDIRSTQHSMGRGRFGVGSVDGLDTQSYGKPIHDSTINETEHQDYSSPKRHSPASTMDRVDMAAQRRANYQHSNTDPQKFSRSDDFSYHGDHCNPGHHTAPGGTPEEGYSFLGQSPNTTVPIARHHQSTQPTLDYRNVAKQKKSSKAKSVDDILKGTEHEPCPRYSGKSVFYQPVARNDENLEEAYRNLLKDDSRSGATTPSTDHNTGHSSGSRSSRNHQSSSTDDLDSGLSGQNTISSTMGDSHGYHTDSKHEYSKEMAFENAYKKDGHAYKADEMKTNTKTQEKRKPVELSPAMASTELEIGSTVEVVGNPDNFRYGVIRWIGYMGDKNKPLVGLEMEVENNSCTDGTFGEFRLFHCPQRKAFFVFLNKVRKDGRFQESPDFIERRGTQAFGSLECPDIAGEVLLPSPSTNPVAYIGKNRGIQGHHNSCYMDACLFSMFAFSTAFDDLLKPQTGSSAIKDKVQLALREGIVNPLRRQFFVRADKIMNLRVLLDEHSKVQGLTHAEKDPEEFLNSLFQDILKAEAFIKLSTGLQSYMYQMILERDDEIVLPTTQQLLGLSFLQSNLKLSEVPKSLILQMPRCGKKYRMYQRVVPSLTLDITDIIDQVPRECTICSALATHECTDCFKHFGDGSLLDITFCEECLTKSHNHVKRSSHSPTPLRLTPGVREEFSGKDNRLELPRIKMELFAVICIETSHYVAIVKAGKEDKAPWLFFDSMADRMGEQHGYNVPKVRHCRELPEWLMEGYRERIISLREDRDLPEHLKRVLCDTYICMYQRQESSPIDAAR